MSDASGALAGRTALITGAGSGIGAATAEALVAAGARVLCAGRTPARVGAVADRLGPRALALALDVNEPRAVASLPGSLPEAWREVDILVNNAGHDVGGRRPFLDGEAEQWAAIIETNVNGLMRVTRALLPAMVARDRGHVLNIGSTAGFETYPAGAAYVASKHAVHGFTESLRKDLAKTGVRVSEVLPGMVRTRFAYARWPDDRRARGEGRGRAVALTCRPVPADFGRKRDPLPCTGPPPAAKNVAPRASPTPGGRERRRPRTPERRRVLSRVSPWKSTQPIWKPPVSWRRSGASSSSTRWSSSSSAAGWPAA